MFGNVMEFSTGDNLRVKMAPLERSDMPAFVQDGRMQSMQVNRFLGRSMAPVEEDEYEWFDKIRADQNGCMWGIYIFTGDNWQLIGNTSINGMVTNTMFRRGSTGALIFDPSFWGRGIIGTCHKARTLYAFRELGISVLYSGAYTVNLGSAKALERIGYVCTGMNRNEGMHAGEFLHVNHYELVNPDDWAWRAWWGDDKPSAEWRDARLRTIEGLAWAEENIVFS